MLVEKIVKKGSKWQVQSEKGRNMGTYDTKEEAKERLRQVEYFKHKDESLKEEYDYSDLEDYVRHYMGDDDISLEEIYNEVFENEHDEDLANDVVAEIESYRNNEGDYGVDESLTEASGKKYKVTGTLRNIWYDDNGNEVDREEWEETHTYTINSDNLPPEDLAKVKFEDSVTRYWNKRVRHDDGSEFEVEVTSVEPLNESLNEGDNMKKFEIKKEYIDDVLENNGNAPIDAIFNPDYYYVNIIDAGDKYILEGDETNVYNMLVPFDLQWRIDPINESLNEAKFSNATANDDVRLVRASYDHFINDLGEIPSPDDILYDILDNYNQDIFQEGGPYQEGKEIEAIKYILRSQGLEYRGDFDESLNEAVSPFVEDDIINKIQGYEMKHLPLWANFAEVEFAWRTDKVGGKSPEDMCDLISTSICYDGKDGERYCYDKNYKVFDNGKVEEVSHHPSFDKHNELYKEKSEQADESLNEAVELYEPLDGEKTFEEFLMDEYGMTLDEIEVEPEVEDYYKQQYNNFLDHLYDLSPDVSSQEHDEPVKNDLEPEEYEMTEEDYANMLDSYNITLEMSDEEAKAQIEKEFADMLSWGGISKEEYVEGQKEIFDTWKMLKERDQKPAPATEALYELWDFPDEDEEPREDCPKCGEPMAFIGYQGYEEEFKCPVCGEYFYFKDGKQVE